MVKVMCDPRNESINGKSRLNVPQPVNGSITLSLIILTMDTLKTESTAWFALILLQTDSVIDLILQFKNDTIRTSDDVSTILNANWDMM